MKVYYEVPCSNMRVPYVGNNYEGFYIDTKFGDFDAVFCANCNQGVSSGISPVFKAHIDEREDRATVEALMFRWRFCPYCGVEFDYPIEKFMPCCCVSEPADGASESAGESRGAACEK